MCFRRARRQKTFRHLTASAAWLPMLLMLGVLPLAAQDASRANAKSPSPAAATSQDTPEPGSTAAAANSRPAASDPPASANPATAKTAAPQAAAAPLDPLKTDRTAGNALSVECANLLKLATSLKTAVDKTNKDELSVPVVLDAARIEQLARKMREDTGER